MGVDRGRLVPPSLLSPPHLHERHQKSFLSSHAHAWVAGRGGWGSLKLSETLDLTLARCSGAPGLPAVGLNFCSPE